LTRGLFVPAHKVLQFSHFGRNEPGGDFGIISYGVRKVWLNLGQALVMMMLLLCTMSCGRIVYDLLDLESDSQGKDTGSGVDIGSESDGPGTDTILDTGGDSGSGTSTLNDTGQDTGSGEDTDTGGGDTGWETSTYPQCSGQPDFAACVVVTVPDRSYDICVEGLCVSPGCGDTSCNVPGPHFSLADTHQRICYDDTSLMSCPLPGQDFFGQDAQYGWDLTHDASERYTRITPVANQSVVQDNVTGLVWQGCSAGLSGGYCEIGVHSEYTWEAALAYCDSLAWAGHMDWRLPDHYEHLSIVDRGRVEPAIDRVFFPETASERFWSSSSYGYNLGHAWCIDLFDGFMDDADKDLSFRVRCVRSDK
jgi:hypothetical protein